MQLPGLTVGPAGSAPTLPGLDTVLLVLWALAVAGLLAALLRAHLKLAREREEWAPARVLDQAVLLSPDRGPAVAGLLGSWVVLPSWALELPEAELRLVLAHEEEHLRARDPHLLALGLGLLLLTPWNPVAWRQLRRLRGAMEVDCDRRVLARHPDRRSYGASLLSVAARASGPSLALAAFSERSTSLEERILQMTRLHDRRTRAFGALLIVVAVLVGVQACGVESPVTSELQEPAASEAVPVGVVEEMDVEPESGAPAEPSRTLVEAEEEPTLGAREEPSFTPFTTAPSIENRMEVVQAMAREYPPLLREAGVGGTVRVYFFINAEGEVERTRLDQSSGHEALDQAALRVAGVYRFEPALNGDEPVPVWVSFPISFQTRPR